MTGPVAFSWSRCSFLDSGHYFFELRGSGKRLPRCFGVIPRLLLEEVQSSLGEYPRVVCTWWTRLLPAALGRLGRALVMRQPSVALGRISCPLRSRCSHFESRTLLPCPCIWQSLFQSSLSTIGSHLVNRIRNINNNRLRQVGDLFFARVAFVHG